MSTNVVYLIGNDPVTSIDFSNPEIGISTGIDFIGDDFVSWNMDYSPNNPWIPTIAINIYNEFDWKFEIKWEGTR